MSSTAASVIDSSKVYNELVKQWKIVKLQQNCVRLQNEQR
jgi:hypothetical protein